MDGSNLAAFPGASLLPGEVWRCAGAAPRAGPRADWGRARADVVRFGPGLPAGGCALRARSPWHAVLLVLDGAGCAVEPPGGGNGGNGGGGRSALRPGRLDAVPAGRTLRARLLPPPAGDGAAAAAAGPSWLVLRFDPALDPLAGAASPGPGGGAAGGAPLFDLRDPALRRGVALLRGELERPVHPAPALLAEAAALLVLARLRAAASPPPPPRSGQGGPGALVPWRLRRCLEHMHGRLGEDVGVEDLASAAGLSPVYFARQFKRATGMAPHQYLIAQRVERAKRLLARGDQPIAEVALACGFGAQEHLTRAFRKATGTTPGAFRRAARGSGAGGGGGG